MYLEPNAVFVDRHNSYARILQICQDTSKNANGYHKRHLVQKEGDEVSVLRTDGGELFTGREFNSGREGFRIIQKPDNNGDDYCLYRLLGVKVAPAVSEEDIWL
jgi:hypothetical protein